MSAKNVCDLEEHKPFALFEFRDDLLTIMTFYSVEEYRTALWNCMGGS